MNSIVTRHLLFVVALFGLSMVPYTVMGSNDKVIVVLSSNLPPYKEALQGLRDVLGADIPSYTLSDGNPVIPASAGVIVAIGGKAAIYPYPEDPILIYCLAPGIKLNTRHHAGALVKIHTNPSVFVTISRYKELQPSLRRLAILWTGDSIQDFIDQKKEIAARLNVDLVSDRIRNPDDLPDHLRALKGKIDAIWLPSDAFIVTPKNFATIKEISLANNIPFYVPSEALVNEGAVASVTTSFHEMGVMAADLTRRALTGSLDTDQVFPEKVHVTVNLTAAVRTGLAIPSAVIKKVDRVIP